MDFSNRYIYDTNIKVMEVTIRTRQKQKQRNIAVIAVLHSEVFNTEQVVSEDSWSFRLQVFLNINHSDG